MKTKVLYCDGDSWTAGDIVDPKLFGDNVAEVHHPDNEQYRLPRVWPHKLGKLLGVKVVGCISIRLLLLWISTGGGVVCV